MVSVYGLKITLQIGVDYQRMFTFDQICPIRLLKTSFTSRLLIGFFGCCTMRNGILMSVSYDVKLAELAKSIGIGIGFMSCIGIVKRISQVLVLLRGIDKYCY